ncbi:glycoside hydrolase family 130 protein [Flavobacterium aurantiibacter]|uniref:4-O-beta-D-mannosyl-D-glucose phosphorylase n=2 Tax=Flavobacterium aurantiibacter TaxID=2023067 RepID=A0A255ZN08_9FLAO|nr:glycosidase [Flavobacterium aurantiibacter]OYQ42947.1 glycosidase [Flavobacterium aurantiibacter]
MITEQITRIPNYAELMKQHEQFLAIENHKILHGNGIYSRYNNPVVTENHVPIHWRYDLNAETNPHGMERIGFNATFNAGAMKWNGKFLVCVRVEGNDRKSFFAMAESDTGVDNFRFWDKPCVIPEIPGNPDTNVYDMRLVAHEDGWIYGIFCTERKDPNAPTNDTSSAVANAGIVRTKDLIHFDRLPDLISNSGQQRNVVIHPEFVDGKYAIYTRPQDGFIDVGSGGGIGLGFITDMKNPVVENEQIIFGKSYHTVYELKNGLGPAPIKTNEGWLHLAHGVRNTAAGLRYTLYLFMTDLNDISRVIYKPAGHFMAPQNDERIGDVSNVLFSNGWIAEENGDVYIYYASSDTRLHVATSTVEKLVDYCKNSPVDTYTSGGSVRTILDLIERNKNFK